MAPMKSRPSREPPTDDFGESYSLTHLAQRWGVPRRAIRQLLQTGELPFVQIEGQLRVPAEAVRAVEATQAEESKA